MKVPIMVCSGLLLACGGDGRVPTRQDTLPTGPELVKENRDAMRLEDRDIDLYAARIGAQLDKTATGVRYRFIRDVEGPTAKPDQWARVNYRLELINGDTAYATATDGPESFVVEMDQVESGLHEFIQLMSPGDSALVVIPSYRAHGLIGDQDRIPMRSTVVYHIGLVAATDRP